MTQGHIFHYSRTPFSAKRMGGGGGWYKIGRGEKWPKKGGRREKSGRKYREEGENEMLGEGRYRREGNFLAFL